ncbi:hypothetical protein G5B30_11345 [Sphingobacterium sp. SGG-5]|uniref:fasciclin domain-containing protein n=1 Tax=Sphingobacterium sp. SGG-5 TaxID=2710881 RepID=UPI0013E9F732|nr:fasciclin domain-containing protein [Sphingobacterium sp. SGG-5]NGM62508.1 hypothetical protein [Sphingobacterium sp. SGG-5]
MKVFQYTFWLACTWIGLLFTSCEKSNTYFKDFEISTTEFDGSTWDYIYSQYGVYDSLVMAIERYPDLKNYLQTSDGMTLFAPNNRGFELSLATLNRVRVEGNKKPLYLEDLDEELLERLLCYYIIQGAYNTESIANLRDGKFVYGYKYEYQMHMQYQNTAASGLVEFGPQQIIFSDTNGSRFHQFWTRTTTASINVKTRNGYVHMLTPGHDFGFNKLIKLFNN